METIPDLHRTFVLGCPFEPLEYKNDSWAQSRFDKPRKRQDLRVLFSQLHHATVATFFGGNLSMEHHAHPLLTWEITEVRHRFNGSDHLSRGWLLTTTVAQLAWTDPNRRRWNSVREKRSFHLQLGLVITSWEA